MSKDVGQIRKVGRALPRFLDEFDDCFGPCDNPTDAVFRSNHASNYLPIEGCLLRDREAILENIDAALSGDAPVRAEWFRGL